MIGKLTHDNTTVPDAGCNSLALKGRLRSVYS